MDPSDRTLDERAKDRVSFHLIRRVYHHGVVKFVGCNTQQYEKREREKKGTR